MHHLTRTLAVLLSLSLFAQNAALALPLHPLLLDSATEAATDKPLMYGPYDNFSQTQPITLAEYQQRARQDAAKAPWITREGKTLLAVGGTAVGLLLVQQMRHNSQMNKLHGEYRASLRNARYNSDDVLRRMEKEHIAQKNQWLKNAEDQRQDWREKIAAERNQWSKQEELLRTQLSEEQAARQTMEKQLKLSQKKTEGLTRSVQTQRAKVQKLIAQSAAREQELLVQIEQLKSQLAMSEERLMHWTYYRNPNIETEMKAYLDLFNKNVSRQERAAMRAMLEREPWVRALPASHQENFLRIIDKGMSVCETGTVSSAGLIKAMTREAVDGALPAFERLVFLVRKLTRPGNLAAVGLLVALGATSYDAHAQKLEDRLNANFNLFLEATPQQLAEMENDENLRKICISGAEALHEMALLSPQEAATLQNTLRQNTRAAHRPVLRGQTAR